MTPAGDGTSSGDTGRGGTSDPPSSGEAAGSSSSATGSGGGLGEPGNGMEMQPIASDAGGGGSPVKSCDAFVVPTHACSCEGPQVSPDHAWQCMDCSDPKISEIIGAEGGTIALADAAGRKAGVNFTLQIPRLAVATETTITISEAFTAPSRFAPTTHGYRVEPLGLVFDVPVALRIPWGSTNEGTSSFSVYQSASECSEPQRLPDSYVNAGFLQGTIKGGGIYFAGTPLGPPK